MIQTCSLSEAQMIIVQAYSGRLNRLAEYLEALPGTRAETEGIRDFLLIQEMRYPIKLPNYYHDKNDTISPFGDKLQLYGTLFDWMEDICVSYTFYPVEKLKTQFVELRGRFRL